jgi:hypothetical protein
MPRKVLIICQHFVPYSPALGGVARVLSLVDYLSDAGFKTYVLTSDGVDFGYLGYEHVRDKATIVYLNDPFKIAMQKTVRHQLDAKKSSNKIFPHFLRSIKNVAYELLMPDPGILMRKKYIEAAYRLLIENNIDNVIVSSPPHSMQLVGLALKRMCGEKVNLVVDYRDSWNGRAIFRQKTVLGRMMARLMEKRVLQACDHFTYVSAPIMHKAFKISGVALDKKSCLVMNGFDDSLPDISVPTKIVTGTKKIRVGHFGMINDESGSYRDVKRILDAIADDPQICKEVQFEFYGQAKLSGKCQQDGVLFFDNLPYSEARKKMLEMDFLLLYHATADDSDEVVTGKFFEYVASKKPIICISPEDMEARRMIVELGIGLVADIDFPEEISQLLLSLSGQVEERYYEGVDVSAFGRSKQNEKMLALLR